MKIKKYLKDTFSKINIKKIYENKNYRLLIYIIIIIIFTFIFVNYLVKRDIYSSIDHKKKIIYFGQTCDLENNKVSINYSKGFEIAFDYINRNGGINGYQLKIILYNDRYEPELASNNAKLLADYFNVLALIGPFGTPTTIAILDDAVAGRNIPVLFPFSAATSYREIFNKYLLLLNGTFYNEFDIMVNNFRKNNIKNVSIIYQDDTYGKSFYNSFIEYILKNNLDINILSSGSYKRNTVDLDESFRKIFQINDIHDYNDYRSSPVINDLQGVILFCAEQQISYLLGALKKIKPSLFIYYNFFVGNSNNNFKDLQYYNKSNIYQTLLSPNIKSNDHQLYNLYKRELNNYNKDKKNKKKINEESQGSYIGFYSGLLIGEVLKNFKDMNELNRDSFTDMFYKKQNFNIYGLKIGPFIDNESNVGLNYVSLNTLKGDNLVMIEQKNLMKK